MSGEADAEYLGWCAKIMILMKIPGMGPLGGDEGAMGPLGDDEEEALGGGDSEGALGGNEESLGEGSGGPQGGADNPLSVGYVSVFLWVKPTEKLKSWHTF